MRKKDNEHCTIIKGGFEKRGSAENISAGIFRNENEETGECLRFLLEKAIVNNDRITNLSGYPSG